MCAVFVELSVVFEDEMGFHVAERMTLMVGIGYVASGVHNLDPTAFGWPSTRNRMYITFWHPSQLFAISFFPKHGCGKASVQAVLSKFARTYYYDGSPYMAAVAQDVAKAVGWDQT